MQPIDAVKGNVSPAAEANIATWLTQPKYAMYQDELRQMISDERWQELEDAFFKEVEFGTGGRRGMTGIGSNRLNKVTVGESAQALCRYALSVDAEAGKRGVVIVHDTRLTADEFTTFAAQVCAANGFKVYLFDGFRATPELSFAVRHLQAAVGVVITASHNPPTDNGFKAYWDDGAQIVPPHDTGVLAEAAKGGEIDTVDYDEAVAAGTIVVLGNDVDEAYVAAAANEAMGAARDLSIVYSPLHGAGQTNVIPVLQKAGFSDIRPVDEQMVPDGNFPSIPSGKPNPEEKAANELAVQKMMDERADIAITNDPDADRIGVVVRQNNEPVYLNGNQSAALAADYVLQHMQERGELTSEHYLAKTIVTTDMLNALAHGYGVNIYDNMLIGFKYIGELIRNKEGSSEQFIIGGEESYGLLKGTYARDKDGASGALLLAEYAAELKEKNLTLYDRLLQLFAEYGLYVESLVNVQLPGADGFSRMQGIMQHLRDETPEVLAGYEVTAVQDYKTLVRRDTQTGTATQIDCINGNVLVFELGDARCRITVRPSGTEPKLKLYMQWYETANAQDIDAVAKQLSEVQSQLAELSTALEAQITAL
ncbi:MAG: phospho-sugar mutase [Candidatus Saccharimonadales bacterium]